MFTFLVAAGFFSVHKKRFLAAGIVFGLAGLTRPVIFPFFLFLFLPMPFLPFLKRQWKSYLLVTTFAILVSSFWIIRNSILFQTFTLTQSYGYGTNLLLGTIETKAWGDNPWDWIVGDSRMQVGKQLDEVEADKERMHKAENYLRRPARLA